MIKTLYKEHCLRYFITPEIISIIIFLFYVPVDPLWILPHLLNNTIKNRFWNLPISWILFKIIIVYFSFKKLEKINKIKDEEKRKKYKIKLKIIIFFTHMIVLRIFIKFIDIIFVIFTILSTNLINQIVNTILSF